MNQFRVFVLAVALGLSGVAARADQIIGDYWAWIGRQDLYNSNGERLSQPWQVLRQDRANVHRFGVVQAGDDWDPWFGDSANRAALERLVARGTLDAATSAAIMRGTSMVHVTIWGNGNRMTWVDVTAPD